MKRRLLAISMLILLGALGGGTSVAHSEELDPVEIARRYLGENSERYGFGPNLDDLEVVLVKESLAASHVRFQQTVNGIPVFEAYITVSINKDRGEVVQEVSRYQAGATAIEIDGELDEQEALDIARQSIGVRSEPRGKATAAQIYYPAGNDLVLAWQVLYPALEPLGDWLVIVRADDGSVLLQQDLIVYDSGQVFDPNPAASSVPNTITTPDGPDDVGAYSSLVLDASGNPVISYWDDTNDDLKLIHCGNPDCTEGNSITSPDTGDGAGQHTSLALDTQGNPVVSYYDFINEDLKVLHCGNPDCTQGNVIATPDTAGDVGMFNSLALDSGGNPVVSYYDLTNAQLKLLRCGNINCTAGNSIVLPDTNSPAGAYSSLELDGNDNPVVSYLGSQDLRVLYCGNPTCSSGNSIETVDNAASTGWFTSLELDGSGNPVVSYTDFPSGVLKVAHCGNPACTSVNNIATPDTGGDIAWSTSLALDADGRPVVSYYDVTDGDLMILHCGDANCTDANILANPNPSDNAGKWSSLALDADGYPVVSYHGITNVDLKVLHCADEYCQGGIPPPADCESPNSEMLLSTQYVTKEILGITEGQNQLKGQYVDLTAPGIIGGYKPAGLASEPSREYVYPCDDDRFEEVMVYYHVDAVQRAIQELGFTGQTGIMNRPIPAHAHFVGGFLSFYSKINRGIHFSDGSVTYPADAAEDADVIIHEYGHAIQDDQVPGWGLLNLLQTRSMGEGFSDFLAAALTGDPCIGEWFNAGIDACSPGIRTLENGVTWNGTAAENLPTWCDNGNDTHCAGLIWGGALWDLVEVLGDDQSARDLVLRLILDAHFYMDPESDFGEALAAIRQADTDLYAGLHLSDIDAVFANRGISLDDLSDFPYAYYRIRHPLRGDLDIKILVGDVANPDCTMNLRYPIPADSKADIVDYVDLEGWPCEVYLPPTTSRPWRLQVRDDAVGNTGTIEDFVIALAEPPTQRCIATDVPVSIPDDDGFVYSVVDCGNLISLLPYQIFLPLVAHD